MRVSKALSMCENFDCDLTTQGTETLLPFWEFALSSSSGTTNVVQSAAAVVRELVGLSPACACIVVVALVGG